MNTKLFRSAREVQRGGDKGGLITGRSSRKGNGEVSEKRVSQKS